jgi:hypothetical protein
LCSSLRLAWRTPPGWICIFDSQSNIVNNVGYSILFLMSNQIRLFGLRWIWPKPLILGILLVCISPTIYHPLGVKFFFKFPTMQN